MEKKFIFHIEYPGDSCSLFSNVHVASGWCFHTSEPISSITLFINDRYESEAILKYPRMDVASVYPDFNESSLFSGFQCYFDPSRLSAGNNTFEFNVQTKNHCQKITENVVKQSNPAPLKISDVFIDITGYCNLRCAMCPQGRAGKLVDRNKGTMSAELFNRVVTFLIERGYIDTYINLYNWGDPLLHPHLNQILSICNEKRLKVIISTNLSVPGNRISTLKHQDVDLLIVSISGFTQETYVRNHVGGDFDRVRKNLEDLANHRDKIKDLVVKYLVFNYNKDEIDLAKNFCESNGFKFGAYTGAIPSVETFFQYLDNPDYRRITQDFLADEQIRLQPAKFCPQQTSITINHQAGLETCCVSWNHGYGMSIFDADIREYLDNKVKNDFCAKCLSSGYSHYKHFGVISPQLLSER